MFYAYKLKPKEHSCSVKAIDGMVYGVISAMSKGNAIKQLRESFGVLPDVVEVSIFGLTACELSILERLAIYYTAKLGRNTFRKVCGGHIYAFDMITGESSLLGAEF